MMTTRQAKRDARQLWHLCLTNGSIDEARARDIVDQVIASGHSGAPAILKQFLRLVKLDTSKRTARVESAAPLAPEVRKAVEDGLAQKYGRAMAATFMVDPALIGGMRLTVGSDVYDGSVKAGLAALESRF
jgi:F-type H+-transporting ATPase subunit delta